MSEKLFYMRGAPVSLYIVLHGRQWLGNESSWSADDAKSIEISVFDSACMPAVGLVGWSL